MNKKLRSGCGAVGKIPVVGIIERGGRVIAEPVDRTDRPTLQGFIARKVKPGSTVMTDEWRSYQQMPNQNHQVVKHSAGEYVRGDVHTNGIESIRSVLKRTYIGVYHYMSPQHLHRYVNELCGRLNMRGTTTSNQMLCIARQMDGKRLRYVDITKNRLCSSRRSDLIRLALLRSTGLVRLHHNGTQLYARINLCSCIHTSGSRP